jgi:hypothetical protein
VKGLRPEILRWVERCAGTGTRVVSVTEMPPSSTEKHVLVVDGGSEPSCA